MAVNARQPDSEKRAWEQLTIDGEPTEPVASSFDPEASVGIVAGDCLATLKDLPGDTFKLVITSPPYNLRKSYEPSLAFEKYLEGFGPVLDELARVLHPEGSLCWQVGNYIQKGEVFPLDIWFYDALKSRALKLRNRIVWHFRHGLHATKRFSGRYETLLWFTKGDQYTFNLDAVRVASRYPGKRHFKGPRYGQPSGHPGGKNPSDVWEIVLRDWETSLWDIPNVKANHPEKTIHPCQFPIELVERCILALTNEGDWVLDPFSGVGSALLAALNWNRRALGCELQDEYVAIARTRIADFYAGRLMYRPLGRPVHRPSGREKVARPPDEWRREGTGREGTGQEKPTDDG